MTDFRLDTIRAGDGCVVAVHGELDLATAPQLEQAILTGCLEAGDVLVDLRGASFIDSTGMRTLLRGRELCTGRGCQMTLVRDLPRPIRRVLEIAGIDENQLPLADPPASGQAQRDDDPALA